MASAIGPFAPIDLSTFSLASTLNRLATTESSPPPKQRSCPLIQPDKDDVRESYVKKRSKYTSNLDLTIPETGTIKAFPGPLLGAPNHSKIIEFWTLALGLDDKVYPSFWPRMREIATTYEEGGLNWVQIRDMEREIDYAKEEARHGLKYDVPGIERFLKEWEECKKRGGRMPRDKMLELYGWWFFCEEGMRRGEMGDLREMERETGAERRDLELICGRRWEMICRVGGIDGEGAREKVLEWWKVKNGC